MTALELALTSIEVDLWLYEPGKTSIDVTGVLPEQLPTEPTLLVGHMEGDLDCRKTFKNLYLDPLLAILNKFDLPNPQGNGWNGIFTDKGVPGETLTLLLDLVSRSGNSDETYAILNSELSSFPRSRKVPTSGLPYLRNYNLFKTRGGLRNSLETKAPQL